MARPFLRLSGLVWPDPKSNDGASEAITDNPPRAIKVRLPARLGVVATDVDLHYLRGRFSPRPSLVRGVQDCRIEREKTAIIVNRLAA